MASLENSHLDSHGLYIHVPFCVARCGYCDFNTYTPSETTSTPSSYIQALGKELELASQLWDREGYDVSTIFFGGGTPSMLGEQGLSEILSVVRDNFSLSPDAEITTEANPESTSPEFFAGLKTAGFTRISLGMQSSSAMVLQTLGRMHTPGRPVTAVKEAKQAGFEHINLDLIYGTPGETREELARSLDAVISAETDHVSAYSLIVEPGTAMYRKVRKGHLVETDDEELEHRYWMVDSALQSAGMQWYEVSNWAKPGGECRHNLLYWHAGQWWGAGPGAHGRVKLAGDVHNSTLVNMKLPARYSDVISSGETKSAVPVESKILGLAVSSVEEITPQDEHTDSVMLGLRLREGIPVNSLSSASSDTIERYKTQGLLHSFADDLGHERIRASENGRYLIDGIITDLLLAEE